MTEAVPVLRWSALLLFLSISGVAGWPQWGWLPSPFRGEVPEAAGDGGGDGPFFVPTPPPFSASRREQRAAAQLLAELEAKSRVSSCWKRAVEALREGCASLRANDASRARLALSMASCDGEADGRRGLFPHCGSSDDISSCVRRLHEPAYLVYVQYRLHADVLCLYVQEEAFQERTEAAVRALHAGATGAAESLRVLQGTSAALRGAMERAAESQAQSAAESRQLHADIEAMREAQKNALMALAETARRVADGVDSAGHGLRQLRRDISESAAQAQSAVHAIAVEAAAQQSRTERHTAGLRRVLDRVEALQRGMASNAALVGDVARAALLLLLDLMLTAPQRTRAARVPAAAVVAVAYAVRPMHHVLFGTFVGTFIGTAVVEPLIGTFVADSGAFFAAVALVASAIIAGYAWAYVTPEQRMRMVLRCEIRRALADAQPVLLEELRNVVVDALANAWGNGVPRESEAAALVGLIESNACRGEGRESKEEREREALLPLTKPNTAKGVRRTRSRNRLC